MKYTKRFISNVLAFSSVALLAMSTLTNLQAKEQEGKVVVRAVRGDVKYSSGKGVWLPLAVGTSLKSGSIVKTGPDSMADLLLVANGSVIRVTPDTEMGLGKLTLDQNGIDTVIDTELSLKSGSILGNVKKMAATSKYEIKLPYGVAVIRYGQFTARVKSFTVVEGSAEVTPIIAGGNVTGNAGNAGGRGTVTVTGGQTFTPDANASAPNAAPAGVGLFNVFNGRNGQKTKFSKGKQDSRNTAPSPANR